MPQFMAGAIRDPGPGPGAGHDLIQALQRQWLAPAGSFEHHEQPVSRRLRGSLVDHPNKYRRRTFAPANRQREEYGRVGQPPATKATTT